MKRFLFFFWMVISVFAQGQKIFSEGTIAYQVSTHMKEQPLDAEVKSIQYIKGSHTRVDLISSLGKTTTLFNSRDGEGAILQEYGSQKIMIPINKENLQSRDARYENIVFALRNETKTILEYPCLMATASLADGTVLEVYYSKELITDNTGIGFQFGKLPGLALEFSAASGDRTVTYRAVSINFEPVPIQLFNLPVSGYRILNFEESQKKK